MLLSPAIQCTFWGWIYWPMCLFGQLGTHLGEKTRNQGKEKTRVGVGVWNGRRLARRKEALTVVLCRKGSAEAQRLARPWFSIE
jgi:hypothetical protein